MNSVIWPNDDGWPYPDDDVDEMDPGAEVDEDVLCLRTKGERLFFNLDPLEQMVVRRHFGLDGHGMQSMGQLHDSTGLTRADLSAALGSGIDKLRLQLS